MEHLIDPDAKGPSRDGRIGQIAGFAAIGAACAALAWFDPTRWLRPPGIALIALAAGLLILIGHVVVARLRHPDRNPLTGATSRRELGLPYQVGLDPVPGRWTEPDHVWRLTIGEQSIDAVVGDGGRARSIPLADVSAVRSRGSKLVLECERNGNRMDVEIVPAAYADRQRMLWELAVRVPDAVERGIDLDASKSDAAAPPPHRAGSQATLPATGPARTGPAAAAPATLDARAAMSNFDAGMDGLGSALAAPSSRPVAPPKSGLGCGLFVAEPKDDGAPDRARAAPR